MNIIKSKILIGIMLITQNMNTEISPAGDNWQMVEFNMTNPSASDVVVDLFDVNGLATPIPSVPSSLPPTIITSTTVAGGVTAGLATNTTSFNVYVCVSRGNSVVVIDRNSYAIIATIVIPNPFAIAYNSASNTMYVVCQSTNTVRVINCTTNTITATISVTTTPQSICYNPLDNTMYVGSDAGTIDVINCSTNLVTTTITVGSLFYGLAHNPYTNTIYATDYPSSSFYVITCSTNTASAPISVGTDPWGICYNSLDNTMYVASSGSNEVYVIDCATNTISGSAITVGSLPRPIEYNPTNNQVYVGNYLASTVTAIACSTNTVFGTISGVTDPEGIAYNSANNSLFVTNQPSSVMVIAPFQSFYISSSSFDYNQFVRDAGINPKIVRQIVLLTTASQLNNNIQILQKDMYGKRYVDNRMPNLMINKFMNQNTIAELDFSTKKNPLLFDCYTSFSQYTINANTTLIMLVYYKESIMAEKLNRSERAVMGTCINMQIPNCSQDATLKLDSEIPNFGEPVISLDEVLNTRK